MPIVVLDNCLAPGDRGQGWGVWPKDARRMEARWKADATDHADAETHPRSLASHGVAGVRAFAGNGAGLRVSVHQIVMLAVYARFVGHGHRRENSVHRADQEELQANPLNGWLREVQIVVDDLDSCMAIALSLLTGSRESNCVALESLDRLTRHDELWLLAHPCPDRTLGHIYYEVVECFTDIGRLFDLVGGDVDAAGDSLPTTVVEDACEKVRELRSLNMNVVQ